MKTSTLIFWIYLGLIAAEPLVVKIIFGNLKSYEVKLLALLVFMWENFLDRDCSLRKALIKSRRILSN